MSLMLDPAEQAAEAIDYYQVGQAHALLIKAAGTPVAAPVLHGRLIASKSGWVLLTVPNALAHGLFDAINERGVELPPGHKGGPFVAHISVMTEDEVARIGGPDKISERGHPFSYQLGPIMATAPRGWSEMSRVWFVKVLSPQLKALRKSYGLTPLPNGDHDFHISIAVRRKNVLAPDTTSKAAADKDDDKDDDGPVKVKIPLSMQRIVITRLTFGKPDGKDGGDGLEDFLDMIRDRARDKAAAAAPADPGWDLSDILGEWHPDQFDPYKGMQGFAASFQPSNATVDALGQLATVAAPTAALAGGLALWRPWERPAVPPKGVRRPKPVVKAAAISDVLNAAYSQLPRMRVPDTVVGAGLGALGGAGYDWLRGGNTSWKKRLGRVLTGAGAGAMLGNVAGDRTRRYIANSLMPFDYAGSPTKALMPKSLSHVWNAAVLDRPQQAVADPEGYRSLTDWNKGTGTPAASAYRKNTLENYVLPARVELLRRQLGVHTDNAAADWWKPGPNNQVSLNPQNPNAVSASQRFMGDVSRPDPRIADQMFGTAPGAFLDQVTNSAGRGDVFGSALMGGQQIPHRARPGGGMDASVLDRWDYTLDPKEQDWFERNALNAISPAWRGQKFAPETPLSTRDKIYPTNAAAWGTLAGRWGLDNLVAYRHPWVTQRFQTTPLPAQPGAPPPEQQLQMLTPEGKPLGDPITRQSHYKFMKGGAADDAPGLPDRGDMGPVDKLRVGQLLDYVVQRHQADRAGLHHDIRFGNPEMGLLSWAARKGLPAPGQKHLAVQQPVHRHDYANFEGEIPEGYGKGTVKTHDKGQVLITHSTPESIHFTTAHQRHPERYVLARPKGWGNTNWLMMNTTPRDQVPYEKVRYKKIPPEQVEPHLKAMQEGDTAEAKVDGASQLVQLAKGHAEMLSYRTSKTTGRPIVHTERFFGGRPDIPVPKHLEGSVLKGEMYASHTGQPSAGGGDPAAGKPGLAALGGGGGAAPGAAGGDPAAPRRVGTPQDVGTLLNSSIGRSLQLQQDRGLQLRNMLYDVQQYGKTPVDPAVTPRNERRKMLEEIMGHLPKDKFHVSEEHKGPEAAAKLWDMIRSGQHPLTEEGVVVHPSTGIPSKAKLVEEHDVHLTGTFPGEGKRQATIGGFTYGHEPGKTVGRVGTGFSDDFLNEVARDPSAYTGRVARLRAQQKLPSGALRAPSFIGLHEDTNKTAAAPGYFGLANLGMWRNLGTRLTGLGGSPRGLMGMLGHEALDNPLRQLGNEGSLGQAAMGSLRTAWGGLSAPVQAGRVFASASSPRLAPTLQSATSPAQILRSSFNSMRQGQQPPITDPNYWSRVGKSLPANVPNAVAAAANLPETNLTDPAFWGGVQKQVLQQGNRRQFLNWMGRTVAKANQPPAAPPVVPPAIKAAIAKPYRDRAEMYAMQDGKVYGGIYDNDRTHGVFGGGIEPGEDPAEAAAREFREESGRTVASPVLLPVPPVTHDWKPPYDTPEQAARAKQFRGSRTFFTAGRLTDEPAVPVDDPSHLKHVRLRHIDTAIARIRENMPGDKPYHPGRIAALEALKGHPLAAPVAKLGSYLGFGNETAAGIGVPERSPDAGPTTDEHIAQDIQKPTPWAGLGNMLPGGDLPAMLAQVEQDGAGTIPKTGAVVADLRRAKAESDRRNYPAKHRILSKLLDEHPGEFVQDSRAGDIVGLTHTPTAFKIHAPADVVRGRAKAAAQAFTYVPTALKDRVLTEGLHSGKALLGHPDLHAAVAEARGIDLDQWKSDIKSRLKSWKPEQSQGPSVLFHEPPDIAALPANHPLRQSRPLSRVNVDLDALLRRRPTTRVHGMELSPYNEAAEEADPKGYHRQRHRDLTPAEIAEIAARPAADVWSKYTDDGRGLYAGDVPHAAIITRGGVIPPRYLKEASHGGTQQADPGAGRCAGGTAGAEAGISPGVLRLRDGRDGDAATPGDVGPRGGRTTTQRADRSDLYDALSEVRKQAGLCGAHDRHDRGVRPGEPVGVLQPAHVSLLREGLQAVIRGSDPAAKLAGFFPGLNKVARTAAESEVRRIVKAIPEADLYGAWYNAVERKARVSLGDWSETDGRPIRKSLEAILGAANVSVEAEIGPPAEAGWTKLADLLPWVKLQPQQSRVAKRVGAGENLLVYHGLGSGKSLASLAAAEHVGGPYTAIVPASLRGNYQKEIAKFTDQKDPAEVMSYTGVGMGKQPQQTPSTVIMDEAQRIRNPNSAGARAAMDMAMKAKHRVLLSGTPIVNSPSDLAVPLSILTGNEMSPAAFSKKFVGSETVHPGIMGWLRGIQPAQKPSIQNEDDLERLLEGHVDYQASRTPEGVKTNDERVEVDLSPEQQNFYKLMWGKLPWTTRWKLSNDYPLSSQELSHLSAFMTGPRQAALSLYPYHSSHDPMRAYQTSSKLQSAMGSLKDTLAQNPQAKALVYSNFVDAGLTPYGAALQHEGIPYGQFHGSMTDEDRKRALEDYNTGKSRVLLLGPAAAEGISAKGTQLIQLLDPHWNEARMGQARGRGLRFDSHEGLPEELRNVRIQRFVAKMPEPGFFGRLLGGERRPSADEILERESKHKEELNEQFREVLRRVGTPGYKRPWSLFG